MERFTQHSYHRALYFREHPISWNLRLSIYSLSAPEFDEHGNVNWRTAWLNELAKLQHITAEQDKLNAEPEWYREMLFRVRTAMMATIDENGVLQVAQAVPTEQLSEEVNHEAQ